ncbi:MAG: hypothetical protein PWQ41_1897 [Bacillota bacterium]|nr:hypothetical protein [Bacillota bacterium]MDK2856545.1 hypothetical protein [Bacillota bacterium]MDK2926123.1 hypothetical protein [Bacillota bacterium]
MKRWLLVFGALALALALGIFTLYSPAARKKEAPQNPKLFSFSGDDVVEITIADRSGSFTLRQTAAQPTSKWEQVAPEKAPVEAAEASFYAEQLAGLTADRELDEAHPDLSQYGLTKPELTITVKLKDGSRHTLYVGAEAPVAMARYVTTDNKAKVYLLASFTADQLMKKPADFRPEAKSPAGEKEKNKAKE